MRTGLTISGAGHAVVLLWCLVAFVARPAHTDPAEAVPIDVISNSDFSKMTNGARNAPPAENPKPVAEKVDAPTPPADPLAKVAAKEVKAATDVPPMPERKPPEPKAKKEPTAPADPIAEALKKDEEKKPEQKKAEVKPPPTPPKKPPQEAPAFDPRQVRELIDKRTPQRLASANEEIIHQPGLGTVNGSASQTSQSELGALQARLQQLWNPPAAAKDPQELTVEVDIQLKPDGTLARPPTVMTHGSSPLFMAAKDSAIRAIYQGQPYTMLRPEHYEDWKDVLVVFDPRYMSRF